MRRIPFLMLLVIAIGLFSKVVGLLREIVLAHYLGTSSFLDMFLVAGLPYYVMAFLASSMAAPFIRQYLRTWDGQGEAHASRLLVNSAFVALLFAALCFCLVLPFSRRICVFFAGGRGNLAELVWTFRIFCVTFFLLPLMTIFEAALNGRKHFATNNLVKVLPHVCLILAVTVFHGAHGFPPLALAIISGVFLQTLILVVSQWHHVSLGLSDPGFGDHWRTAAAFLAHSLLFFLATLAFNQDFFIDRFMGIRFGQGVLSALGYGSRIASLPYFTLVMPVTAVLVPFIVSSGLGERSLARTEVVNLLSKGISIALFILLPSAFFNFYFREDLIRLFLMRGAFNQESLDLTSAVMKYYAPNICFLSLTLCLGLSFSLGLRRWAVLGSLLGVCIKIALVWGMRERIGFQVLPLGTMLATCTLLVSVLVPLQNAYPFLRIIAPSIAARMLASLLGVALCHATPGNVIVHGIMFVAVYAGVCALARDPMIASLKDLAFGLLKRRRAYAE